MAASTGKKRADRPRLAAVLAQLSPSLIVGAALLAACVAGGLYAWRQWGRAAAVRMAGTLTPDDIGLPPQPDWIKADVKGETFRDGSLGELSVLERETAYKVFRAFELHAWVAKVKRVSKSSSGRVTVDLRYRRPVAWVEIPGFMSPDNKDGLLAVDEEGVLLPPEDFGADQIERYLRIKVSDLTPHGPVGTSWPDARVVAAAQLAALLDGQWPELRLHRILVSVPAAGVRNGVQPLFELASAGGDRFIWGSAPGQERSGEASTVEKIELLRQLADNVATRRPGGPLRVDLRQPAPLTSPRTARGR